MSYEPKIICWDVETSPMIVATFSLKNNYYIPHTNILQDWYIITASWKEVGKKTVHRKHVACDRGEFHKDPSNDLEVVKALRDVVNEADVLVAHNGDRFDLKKLNARLIYHGLDPINHRIQTVDTLKEVRKVAGFSSNSLDYLTRYLTNGGKMKTPKGLWLDCLDGEYDAVITMADYCDKDVTELEDLYLKLRPYMKSHPNMSSAGTRNCPKCNSSHVHINGYNTSKSGLKYTKYQCQDCGTYYQDRYAIKGDKSDVKL